MGTKRILLLAGTMLAASLFASPSVHAGVCTDAWNDSEAADHCTARVERVVAGTGTGSCVLTITCSITVSIDGTDTAFSPSKYTTQTVANTDDLDICFKPQSEGSGFDDEIRVGCPDPYTSSDDAVSNGLSTE